MSDLEKKLEEATKGIVAIQERVTEFDGKLDGLDKEVINKAGADAAKALEEIQQLNQKATALENMPDDIKEMVERVDAIEAEVARGGGGESKDAEKASGGAEYKNALSQYIRKGKAIDSDVERKAYQGFAETMTKSADANDVEMLTKDLLSGSGPDGGYAVPADRSSMIVRRLFETSPLRPLANVQTTSSQEFEYLLDDDEAEFGWVGEVEDRDTTGTPKLAVVKIPLDELFAQPRATQRILDDAMFDIEGWLQDKIADRFMRAENAAFVNGNGASQPKGFTTYPNWTAAGVYQRDAVEQIPSTAAGALNADDIISLQNSLLEMYQMNASWGMDRNVFTVVAQLKDSENQYLLDPRVLKDGNTKVLMGSEVTFLNDMTNTIATNGLPIVYADWRQFYTIVDRMGIRLLRDPYTQKPYIRFYTTKRVGGRVTNFQAGKLLRIT